MGDINYSIRLDEETREKMDEVPDMPDRIREFIQQEVERHKMGGDELPEEQFCRHILSEYGIVGAYCLRQRHLYYQSKRYYLQNIETWFEDHEIDTAEARLQAKRIWDEWDDFAGDPNEVVEDILDIEGFIDEFYSQSRSIAQIAAENSDIDVWILWSVVQIYRHLQDRSSVNQSSQSIKRRSIKNTLEIHGFEESEIEEGFDVLIKAGGFQNLYNSNAYTYQYIKFSDYIIDAIEEGLESHKKEVRSTIRDYCDEEPYLDQLLGLTRGNDRNQYEKTLSDQSESDLSNAVKDGAVILRYSPGRSSTGRRSSLPSKTKAVLSPAIREIVSDAVYQHKVQNN